MHARIVLITIALVFVTSVAFAGGAAETPLGSEENPIVWSFVPSGEMEQVAAGAEQVAELLNERTGLYFETNVATEYAGVIEALSSDPPEAHMASLATFAYIVAADRGVADAALVAVRYGSPTYNGQIIANAETDIASISDLPGKTFARPDPLSTSGWIIPMITMRAAGIDPQQDLRQIVDAGSHNSVVAAVYNGDVDAGASYVDARSTLEDEHADVMDKVRVVKISQDIPNDGVQFVTDFDEELRQQIVEALLAIADTEEGTEALGQAYSWTGLVEVSDQFYDPFRQIIQASGINPEDYME
jgi:phosphonate transport system substrate-binding protein